MYVCMYVGQYIYINIYKIYIIYVVCVCYCSFIRVDIVIVH